MDETVCPSDHLASKPTSDLADCVLVDAGADVQVNPDAVRGCLTEEADSDFDPECALLDGTDTRVLVAYLPATCCGTAVVAEGGVHDEGQVSALAGYGQGISSCWAYVHSHGGDQPDLGGIDIVRIDGDALPDTGSVDGPTLIDYIGFWPDAGYKCIQ